MSNLFLEAVTINDVRIGKYISFILRHHPEAAGIELDKNGWADTQELICAVRKKYQGFDMAQLEYIVENNDKKRYSFNEDKSKIRARQGHSVDVDVELKKVKPPEFLYHGTARRFLFSIMKNGIVPGSRLYVHLSPDEETAGKVGSRHGEPAILKINAGEMEAAGYSFYLSENGVWLTKLVPTEYFSILR